MMAGVVTTGPDGLRVDAVFYRKDDLAGLIWESEDKWDHPLLCYETHQDFRRCRLRFRWRSSGVKALDAVHGPTLTIEGRDESRSEEHTSELQSLMRISYAVFCLTKNNN